MSLSTLSVLNALLADPGAELYGLDIAHRTDLTPGTIYLILLRLRQAGWVRDRWEDVDPRHERRPCRHYYQLTELGAVQAREAVGAAQKQLSRAMPVTLTGLA